MNHTLLDERFRQEGRKTWCLKREELERELDRFLAVCDLERSHHGYRLQGGTPAQASREAPGVETLSPIVSEEELSQPEAA